MVDEPETREELNEPVIEEPETDAAPEIEDDESEHTSFSDRFRFTHLEEGDSQRWLRLAAQILVGIIIILLLLLAGRYIHHHYFVKKNPSTTTASTGSSTPGKLPSASGSNGSGSSSNHSGSSSTGSESTAGSSAGKSATGKGASQLANTGPGDTAAIFVGASLLAAGTHYLYSARRHASE